MQSFSLSRRLLRNAFAFHTTSHFATVSSDNSRDGHVECANAVRFDNCLAQALHMNAVSSIPRPMSCSSSVGISGLAAHVVPARAPAYGARPSGMRSQQHLTHLHETRCDCDERGRSKTQPARQLTVVCEIFVALAAPVLLLDIAKDRKPRRGVEPTLIVKQTRIHTRP